MPFPFVLACDLLDQAYDLCVARKENANAVIDWFSRHRHRIKSPDCNLAALLSTLLPEKRTDRVYCIQAPRLERIIARALMLGSSRKKELSAYKQPGRGLDLADCVERILSITPNPARPENLQITVEEIDSILHGIASKIRWSSPSIRAADSAMSQGDQRDLAVVYRQLSPRETKWFTRLVLKDFQPLIFEPHLIYRSCDTMLPFMLKIQDDFATAIQSMQQARVERLSRSPRALCSDRALLATIRPRLAVKVGRQQWFKARSIKHCLDLCNGLMSVETKMDGEYCQIHVDVSKGRQAIQIFSKSGKDSTEDRSALIGIILESLKIGKPDCNIQKECILEGELLVYSDHEQKVLPFHHIRNHVKRRGRFMNAELDSRPRPYEHLMIIYYDMLLLDGESLLGIKHSERFNHLQKTVLCDKGRAELVHRRIIDTSHGLAVSALRNIFAKVIIDKGEGLVLKPDKPFFNFFDNGLPFSGRCIKLKKEYIGKFGDVGDFAVVGAGFHPPKAKSYHIPNLKWTHFFIGCLENREEVKRWGAKPKFTVVNEVELNATMLHTFVTCGETICVPVEENKSTILKLTPGVEITTPMTNTFVKPPVFDVRCFGFEKAGNTGFWGLRFPAVTKIHFDRDFSDTVSFEELQGMAEEAVTVPAMEDSQENLAWIAKLEGADPRGVAVDALTQRSTTTAPTPSPRKFSEMSNSCPSLPSIEAHTVESQESRGKKRSHASISDASPSQPHKRSKCLGAKALQNPSSPEVKNPVSRQPLGDIQGNSVQPTTPSSNSPSIPISKSQPSSQRRPNRMETAKALPAVVQGSGKQNHASNSEPSNPSMAIGSNDENECPQSANSSSGARVPLDIPRAKTQEPSDRTAQEPQVCRFAGSKCQLAKKVVLLTSELASRTKELMALLKDHGLSNLVLDPETWAKEDRLRSLSTQDWQPGSSALWLVDTVEAEAETRCLLAAMEEIRCQVPEEKRNWIGVYDWRVLRHVSILENDDVTKKYYDGFHDPWRRWYSGLL